MYWEVYFLTAKKIYNFSPPPPSPHPF